MTRNSVVPVVLLVGVLVAGCGADTEPAVVAPQVSSASRAGLVLEPAVGTPVVTFKGQVNGGRSLPVDLASLDALPSQRLTVVEPFVKKSITFEGVAVGDLMDAAKATGTSLTVHALDDYEVTFDDAVLREQGAVLATHADGAAIALNDGGPVRLVFPTSSKAGRNSDFWVWSVDQILVE